MENSPMNTSLQEEATIDLGKKNSFAALGTPGSTASSPAVPRSSASKKRQSLGPQGSAGSTSSTSKRRRSSLDNSSILPSAPVPPVGGGDEDLPPLAGSPTPARAPGVRGRRKSTGNRRETAESADLRDLMATLQRSTPGAGTPSTVATFHTGRDSSASIASIDSGDFRDAVEGGEGEETKKRKKSKKRPNRRLTADGADLESLLAGLDEEEEEASSTPKPSVSFAGTASPAASSPSNSMLMNDLSNASSNASSLAGRVPTPHAKMGPNALSDRKGEEEEEEEEEADDLPPLPDSPIEPRRSTRNSKRAASLGGAGASSSASKAAKPVSILNKGKKGARTRGRASIAAMPDSTSSTTSALDAGADKASKKKAAKKKKRRSVAFGSPQAAEFNSSSPSASLTPMPTHEAKEKYTVPDGSMMSEESVDTSGASLLPPDSEADNTVELEGDLNALMTSIGQGHGTDGRDDDENTVELEGDISALLKNADDTPHKDDEDDFVDPADTTMELEADMGSLLATVSAGVSELRRLSASSPGGIASLTKTSPTSHHVTLAPPEALHDDELSGLVAGAQEPTNDLNAVKLDLCAVEIVGFCEREEKLSFDQAVHSVKSSLVDACNGAQNVASHLVSLTSPSKKKSLAAQHASAAVVSTIHEVLSAASSEVSKKVDQTRGGGAAILETVRSANPGLLKAIQVGIRRHDNADFHSKIRELYNAVKRSVVGEWKVWEGACSGALLKALETTRDGLSADADAVAEAEGRLEEAGKAVKAVKGRAARKAMRASLDRKAEEARGVKAEVEALEEQLREAEAKLLSCEEEAAQARVVSKHNVETQAVKKDLAAASKRRKTGEKKFKSLEGLLMWSPVLVDSSKVIVDFVGGEMDETKVSLGFDLKNKVGIQVFMMEKKPEAGSKARKKSKKEALAFNADARRYAVVKIKALMDYINNDLTVKDGSEIPQILQNVEFQVGRIETVAAELTSLTRAYDCVFEIDEEAGSLAVTTDLVSRTQNAKIRAVWTLPDSEYPFTPMSACFESLIGGVAVEKLGDSLRTNVTPGHGYLRRAFDTVAAFLK